MYSTQNTYTLLSHHWTLLNNEIKHHCHALTFHICRQIISKEIFPEILPPRVAVLEALSDDVTAQKHERENESPFRIHHFIPNRRGQSSNWSVCYFRKRTWASFYWLFPLSPRVCAETVSLLLIHFFLRFILLLSAREIVTCRVASLCSSPEMFFSSFNSLSCCNDERRLTWNKNIFFE